MKKNTKVSLIFIILGILWILLGSLGSLGYSLLGGVSLLFGLINFQKWRIWVKIAVTFGIILVLLIILFLLIILVGYLLQDVHFG